MDELIKEHTGHSIDLTDSNAVTLMSVKVSNELELEVTKNGQPSNTDR